MAKRRRSKAGKGKLHRIHREQPGAPPGTLKPHPGATGTDIEVISYGPDEVIEDRHASVDAALALRGKRPFLWINVDGVGDADAIKKIGKAFGVHHLTLEDVLHVHQRPKVEYFENYVFVVVRMLHGDEIRESEQLAIVFGADFVLTFQEGKPGDCFDPLRQRLRQNRGVLRRSADYFAYALIDTVTDHYFPVLENYADRLDGLEDEVLEQPYLEVIWQIHAIKRDMMMLHRIVLSQRDLIASLIRDSSPLVGDEARLHLRDVADHTAQIVDLLAAYREMAQSLIEIHLNVASNRMNEVMKLLTIIGAIFIPLTFVVGVYGMNFDPDSSPFNMPELRMRYGYPITMGVMLLTVIGMLVYFQRRGWLRPPR